MHLEVVAAGVLCIGLGLVIWVFTRAELRAARTLLEHRSIRPGLVRAVMLMAFGTFFVGVGLFR